VVGGILLLASIGIAQWSVLRHHVRGSAQWVEWNALAWVAGLGLFTLVTTPLWHPGQNGVATALIGALGGALMAVTVGAVTGRGLVRLVSREHAGAAVR
jgi:Ca2+-transporting ATPase